MFCSECGKEIVNDAKICSYCGKPVQGNNQPYNNVQPNINQQYYSNPANNARPPYGNPPYIVNSRNFIFKPDNKFNLVAGLFTWIWSICKGMWDLFLIDFLVHFLFGLLVPFGIGLLLWVVYLVARIVFIGRNANYYYRLKETQKIPMYKAIQDPNLRRV